jgi:hypothetical protein
MLTGDEPAAASDLWHPAGNGSTSGYLHKRSTVYEIQPFWMHLSLSCP